jgi:hypothetical protein
MLESGEYATIREIAAVEKISESYVAVCCADAFGA